MIPFFSFLLQRCSVDDDDHLFRVNNEGSNHQSLITKESPKRSTEEKTEEKREGNTTDDEREDKKQEDTSFSFAKRLSRKWSTGNGPRIGCVREYPTELQFRALEQVNLSPRVANGGFNMYGPIPSPRPSPKIRLSPRIAYMGLPSPRTPISAAN